MIYRYAMPCPVLDPLSFLSAGKDQARAYFSTADGKTTFAGLGHAAEGIDCLHEIEILNDGPAPRLFGGFAFDEQPLTDAWQHFPQQGFWLYEVEYHCTPNGAWLILNSTHKADAKERLQNLLDNLPIYSRAQNKHESQALVSRNQWIEMVAQAVTSIQNKELEKVVLARPLVIQASDAIDPITALAQLNREYPSTYRFLIEPQPGYAFIGATPEQLVKAEQGALEATALAGSAPRGETIDADMALAGELLQSEKNRHEHQLVIDELQMQLAGLTTELTISSAPLIHALPNVQHLRTPIQATLKEQTHILDVVRALHPTPALGGLPRDKAMAMINELEPHPRGWYGAPLGWFDAEGNGEFVVSIRSAVISNNTAWAYAGAGIVADSDPQTEWEETQVKLRPMLSALGVTQ